MKAISRNLLSPLTEHNQTEAVMWDGGIQLVGDFFLSCLRHLENYLIQM